MDARLFKSYTAPGLPLVRRNFQLSITTQNGSSARLSYFKGDYKGISHSMQEIDWDTTLEGLILFQSWFVFAEKKLLN